jgi:hypothetical protein
MNRRIAGLIRNPFRVHGLDQLFAAGAGKLHRVDVENVRVVAVASTSRVEFLRRDSRYLRKQLVEQTRVLMTPLRLAVEARELRAQDRALPLAETTVRAVDVVAVKPLTGHAAAVMHAARLALELHRSKRPYRLRPRS